MNMQPSGYASCVGLLDIQHLMLCEFISDSESLCCSVMQGLCTSTSVYDNAVLQHECRQGMHLTAAP